MRISFFVLTLIFFTGIFGTAFGQTKVLENSGFVPGNLWFSKTPNVIGESVQVYTMIWNGSDSDITGTVSFFDNANVISKQNFVLAGGGSTKILSTVWKAEDGYHKIYAQITGSQGGLRGSKAVDVALQYPKTSEEEHFVKAPEKEATTTTAIASNFVNQKVDYATGYLEANLPGPVTGTVKSIASGLESARTGGEVWMEKKISGLKSNIAKVALEKKDKVEGGDSSSGFSVEGPFKYASLALLSAGKYIFGNSWLFYGLGLVVVSLVLRFIKQKFFF